MVIAAGVDIGSTASKAVVVVDGDVRGAIVGTSSVNPARTAEEIFEKALSAAKTKRDEVAYVVGTGYGRTLVPFAQKNVSEITCHGRGAHHILPSARTVIDIGGQDTKVIRIDEKGNLLDFAMNDKCAAGTGRFLEAMARSMDMPLGEMEEVARQEGEPCRISNMCSVFAESEVINLINEGVELSRIVKGLLASMARRVAALARRLGLEDDVMLTGGVAKNGGVCDALERRLGIAVAHPYTTIDPQLVGALGAALIAMDLSGEESTRA
jgi:predicted CoA-substrate-specific enzyme activase